MIQKTNKWILLLALGLIWGSSFILIKKSISVFPPNQVAALRLFISFIAFVPFFYFRKAHISFKKIKPIIIVAIFGNGIPAYLFALAQTKIDSSIAGTLNSLTPIFTLLLGILFFKKHFFPKKLIGIFIGLCGALLLILYGKGLHTTSIDFKYAALIVVATMCYAISLNVLKTYLQEMDAIIISAIAFLTIGPISGIYLFSTDFIYVLQNNNEAIPALLAVSALAVLGTAFALILFNNLVQKTDAIFASMVTYILPIIASIWGFLDNEILTIFHIFGIILVLIGVRISNLNQLNIKK